MNELFTSHELWVKSQRTMHSICVKIISYFILQLLNSIALAFWTTSRRRFTFPSWTCFPLNAFFLHLFRRTLVYWLNTFRSTTRIFDLLARSFTFILWTQYFILFFRFYLRTEYIPNMFSNHLVSVSTVLLANALAWPLVNSVPTILLIKFDTWFQIWWLGRSSCERVSCRIFDIMFSNVSTLNKYFISRILYVCKMRVYGE